VAGDHGEQIPAKAMILRYKSLKAGDDCYVWDGPEKRKATFLAYTKNAAYPIIVLSARKYPECYRHASRYDWSSSDNWIAVAQDGEIQGFKNKPVLGIVDWGHGNHLGYMEPGDWEESLEERQDEN